MELTRRDALKQALIGSSALGLGGLLPKIGLASEAPALWTGVLDKLHFTPRAKRVIWLYMAGGPSHVDLFDPKPELTKRDGEAIPESLIKGEQLAQLTGQSLICKGADYPFKLYGESGMEMSALLPHIGDRIADKICLIRSMVTDQINHDTANNFMNTGGLVAGRPSLGAWLDYGMGSENADLPSFVVLTSDNPEGASQPLASRNWHNGFLPGRFQGVKFRSGDQPIPFLRSPGVSRESEAGLIERIKELNALHGQQTGDPESETRNVQYDLAHRMQSSIPKLADLSSEPDYIRTMYGVDDAKSDFAANCLMARRLVEQGVRFVQVYHRGWDHHSNIAELHPKLCRDTDQASAALVLDLEQRGMLEDTLVIWGGEFGRTPMAQGNGRDHHIKGFSNWMAGGGVKPGFVYGATDDFGFNAVADKMHVHDFHATILHLLGIDHTRLTYRHQGRDFRLTDVYGNVAKRVLA